MELTRTCITDPPLPVTQTANFTFYKGTTFRAKLTFKNPDQTPLNITGMDIVFNIVEIDGTPTLIVNSTGLTTNNSTITIINANLGQAEVLITDEETSSLDVGELKWWVTLNPLNGDKLLRGKGKILVSNPY